MSLIKKQLSLTIDLVLPCYNPIAGWAENIAIQYKRYQAHFAKYDIGLFIVNDGSSAINRSAIEKLKKALPGMSWIDLEKNQGKGAALRKGVEQSEAKYVVFTDIDFPFTFESLVRLTDQLISGESDIVAGNRPSNYYTKTPGERKVISKLLRWVNRNIFNLAVSDTQCGLKGFNQNAKKYFLATEINRYLFDLEFLMLASSKKAGLKIKPCVVELREEVVFSKLNSSIYFSEGKNIIKLYFRKLFS